MLRRALLTTLLCLCGGAAVAQVPPSFVLGGAFLDCPLGLGEEGNRCRPARETWTPYIGRSLHALTSEGRQIDVVLKDLREDATIDGTLPVLETPKGLHANERVLLAWNTNDTASLVQPRTYAATPEEQAMAHAMAVMAYMPDRWRMQNFGRGEMSVFSEPWFDPSDPANLRVRWFALDDAPVFVFAEATPVIDEGAGRQFEGHRQSLLLIDRLSGTTRTVSVESGWRLVRFDDGIFVVTQSTGYEDTGVSMTQIARDWSDPSPLPDNDIDRMERGKLLIADDDWIGFSLSSSWASDDAPAFLQWPESDDAAVDTPFPPGASQ